MTGYPGYFPHSTQAILWGQESLSSAEGGMLLCRTVPPGGGGLIYSELVWSDSIIILWSTALQQSPPSHTHLQPAGLHTNYDHHDKTWHFISWVLPQQAFCLLVKQWGHKEAIMSLDLFYVLSDWILWAEQMFQSYALSCAFPSSCPNTFLLLQIVSLPDVVRNSF